MPVWRRRTLTAVRAFFTPLLPDDHLELINPLWSTQELCGRIERIVHETDDAVTAVISRAGEWEGHKPGQYLRVGFEVDGQHHWRASSITSDPGRPDGCIAITPKLLESGHGHAVPRAQGHAWDDRPPRRGGGHVHAAGPPAGRERRQRDHAGDEHAPAPRPRRAASRRRPYRGEPTQDAAPDPGPHEVAAAA